MTLSQQPNLFVVGAPKSGTTTLIYWMRHHPGIFVSTPKEPMYYGAYSTLFGGPDADQINAQCISDRAIYLALFRGGGDARYRAEGSTDYLSAPGAAERIHADCPGAKIVIMLRDPVSRAFSEHSHLVRDNLETLSFRAALDLEDTRAQAHWNTLFRHKSRSLYCEAVGTYLDRFGADNVMVALYDDLHADPAALRKRLFTFLELEDLNLGAPRLNQSGIIRSRLLYDIARGRVLPAPVKALIGRILGRQGISNLQAAISNRNLRKLEMTAEDREFLRGVFREDVAALSELLGQDLQKRWLDS